MGVKQSTMVIIVQQTFQTNLGVGGFFIKKASPHPQNKGE